MFMWTLGPRISCITSQSTSRMLCIWNLTCLLSSYKPLEPRDFKEAFKGNCRVPLKGFGVIMGRFRVVVIII